MKTLTFSSSGGECRNPTLRRVWGWNSHSRNGDLGVLRDSQCRNPTLRQVWGWNSHSPKSGNLESAGTPENSKLDCRGQNTLPWNVIISLERSWSVDVENGLACTILTSAAQVMVERRAGSQNWQFNSQPLKVGNRPNLGVRRWSATHCWKAFEENYKFA
jgi:hypothetical protein